MSRKKLLIACLFVFAVAAAFLAGRAWHGGEEASAADLKAQLDYANLRIARARTNLNNVQRGLDDLRDAMDGVDSALSEADGRPRREALEDIEDAYADIEDAADAVDASVGQAQAALEPGI